MKPDDGILLEVCCGSPQSVAAAARAGVKRVELCVGLAEGGVTPPMSLIDCAVRSGIERVHVLIRPRGGDFVYDEDEVLAMLTDIDDAADRGAHGVVTGALTPDGDIDMDTCRRLVEQARRRGLVVTFHRAIDMARDLDKALDDVIALGCDIVLTSGGEASAELGIEALRGMHERAAGRILIMAGCGVNGDNAARILAGSHADQLHASARKKIGSSMRYRNEKARMGAADADEFSRMETSEEAIAAINTSIRNYQP